MQLHTPLHTPLERKDIAKETSLNRQPIVDPLSPIANAEYTTPEQDDNNGLDSMVVIGKVSLQNFGIFGSLNDLVEDFLKDCCISPGNPIKDCSRELSIFPRMAKSNAWKNVLDLSTEMLKDYDLSKVPLNSDLRTLLFYRLEGLFRMKMFDELATDVGKFISIFEDAKRSLEGPAIDKNLVTIDKRICSHVIISLKVLFAEVKFSTGRGEEAVEQLYILRDILLDEASELGITKKIVTFWVLKVNSCIINMLIRQRQWKTVITHLHILLLQVKNARSKAAFEADDEYLARSEIITLCRLSRVMLQVGDISTSLYYTQLATTLLSTKASFQRVESDVSDQVTLALGISMFCQDQYENAQRSFEGVIDREIYRRSLDTVPLTICGASLLDDSKWEGFHDENPFQFGFSQEESLLSMAINNYAVCALFMKKVDVAMKKLENFIQDNPPQNLTDPVVFNLCTIYDLSFSVEVSTNKKKMLQRIAAMYFVDGLNWRSFRLT